MSFAGKFGDIYGTKFMDTVTKTEIHVAKTASKWVVKKTAEVTWNLIGNKKAGKITSAGKKKKVKKKKTKDKKSRYHKKKPSK